MNTFEIIGLMSGTSLDGLDIVHVKFKKNDYTFFEILSLIVLQISGSQFLAAVKA